jgi:sugar phosphate isomerase/epimerase
MKYCYAPRRQAAFPDVYETWTATPEQHTDAFLKRVAATGYDGLEIGAVTFDAADSDSAVVDFADRLRELGAPCVVVRAGGSLLEAKTASINRDVLDRSLHYAKLVGARVVTGNMMAPQRHYRMGGDPWGRPVAQDASRGTRTLLFERLAEDLRIASDAAATDGITVSLELHQQSPVDNSWSAKLISDLVARTNFGINADLGNILWNYDEPEETIEAAVDVIGPISVYWHCKNVVRVNHPENQRTVAWKVSLAQGEMDYRYLMLAMARSGYNGYVAIEGGRIGDQWHMDTTSLAYLKDLEQEMAG